MSPKFKVFVEYKIMNDKMIEYRNLIPKLKELHVGDHYSVYESIEQPGLFVEEFFVSDSDEYAQAKTERLQGKVPIWNDVANCIDGGIKKMNVWAFAQI